MIIENKLYEPSSADGARPIVLLVEDEALVAMVAEESLRDIGFEPVVAATAAAAMRMLETGPTPVLAIVDVGLPDERGDKLALRIRAIAPDIRIIIASGYDEHTLRAGFSQDPLTRILAKPYTEEDLAQAIRDLNIARANAS